MVWGTILSTSKWAISRFSGGSERPGWFVHFLAQFGNVKKNDGVNRFRKKCHAVPV